MIVKSLISRILTLLISEMRILLNHNLKHLVTFFNLNVLGKMIIFLKDQVYKSINLKLKLAAQRIIIKCIKLNYI